MRYTVHTDAIEAESLRDWLRLTAGYRLRFQPAVALGRLAARIGCRAQLPAHERRVARGVLRALDVGLAVSGAENIDPGRRYVVAPLHESAIDPIVIMQLPLPRVRFVIRREILDWRTLGPYLQGSRHVAVTPEGAIGAARALLSTGLGNDESLVVFPQGTVLGLEAAFHGGPFWLAETLGLPLLPVVLTGTHRVWEYPFHPTIRTGQEVAMTVLPPIDPVDLSTRPRTEMVAAVQTVMKDIALGGHMPPPRRFVPARDGFWDGYRYDIDPRFTEVAAAVHAHRSAQTSRRGDSPKMARGPSVPAA